MFFCADFGQRNRAYIFPKVVMLPGFAQSALRYPEETKAALRQRTAKGILIVVTLFSRQHIPTEPFLPELVALLFSIPSKCAKPPPPLLYPTAASALPLLEGYLREGKANEKLLAVQWLSKIGGDSAVPLLIAHRECETNEKVVSEITHPTRVSSRARKPPPCKASIAAAAAHRSACTASGGDSSPVA